MRLPIDTNAMSFKTAGDPRPVLDFNTQEPRTDKDGNPLFAVRVFASGEDVGQVIEIKVAGQPAGVRRNQDVQITGLTVQPWTLKSGKSGIAFRAAVIAPANGNGK